MIENYKGWDITLTWSENKMLKIQSNNIETYNHEKKWVGVDSVSYTHLTLPTNC